MYKKHIFRWTILCVLFLGLLPMNASSCLFENCQLEAEPISDCSCSHEHQEEQEKETILCEENLLPCHHHCSQLDFSHFYSDSGELLKAKQAKLFLRNEQWFSECRRHRQAECLASFRRSKPTLPPPHLKILASIQLLI